MMINKTRRSPARFVALVGLAVLASLLAILPVARADSGTVPPTPIATGNYYTVQPGDTWNTVAQRTGVNVTELIRLNPQATHPNYWLWIGDRLLIPDQPAATAQGYWYLVKPGDTWGSVSRATGISMAELWRANPSLLDWLRWLYIGQQLWIPAAPPAAASTTAQAAAAAAAGALAGAAAPASTPTPSATQATENQAAATATPTPPPAVQPEATAMPAQTTAAGCPAALAAYPDAITAYLNDKTHNVDGLKAWLASCKALSEGEGQAGVILAALQSAKSADIVIAIADPTSPAPEGKGALLVYHAQADGGYTLAHQVEGTGAVALLKAGDINMDGKADLVWTDTTCGAHTCTSTLYVASWDGNAYQSWIEGAPQLASADYTFMDVTPDGSGQEILAHGGLVGSAGAGPQRAWTETYASPNGGPYKLIARVYEKSSCLYHAILDADAALNDWATDGFELAIAAYQAAVDNQTLTACWTLQDEVALLRDYARFRLVIAQVANGQAALGNEAAGEINSAALKDVAQAFLKSYKASGSVVQACRDTTDYAVAHPDAWKFMVDWGYANPTITAEGLCPVK